MARAGTGLINRIADNRAVKRWNRVAAASEDLTIEELRALRGRAKALRREVDRALKLADGRLALPIVGSQAMHVPAAADWSWRPDFWRLPATPHGAASVRSGALFTGGLKVFHDCGRREITLRQDRNQGKTDLAAFGLHLDVFNFDGNFLSVVLDLPPEALVDLGRRHLIVVQPLIEAEKPLTGTARLNLRNGPNVGQVHQVLDCSPSAGPIEFDIAYSSLGEGRGESGGQGRGHVTKAWVELLFEAPGFNRITLRDLTFYRRPRSQL